MAKACKWLLLRRYAILDYHTDRHTPPTRIQQQPWPKLAIEVSKHRDWPFVQVLPFLNIKNIFCFVIQGVSFFLAHTSFLLSPCKRMQLTQQQMVYSIMTFSLISEGEGGLIHPHSPIAGTKSDMQQAVGLRLGQLIKKVKSWAKLYSNSNWNFVLFHSRLFASNLLNYLICIN